MQLLGRGDYCLSKTLIINLITLHVGTGIERVVGLDHCVSEAAFGWGEEGSLPEARVPRASRCRAGLTSHPLVPCHNLFDNISAAEQKQSPKTRRLFISRTPWQFEQIRGDSETLSHCLSTANDGVLVKIYKCCNIMFICHLQERLSLSVQSCWELTGSRPGSSAATSLSRFISFLE